MKKLFFAASVVAILALAFSFVGSVFAAPAPHVKVTVCHATGSQSNPYSKVTVNVNSVGVANSLNGHAGHGGDIWASFMYNGVQYAGQGDQSILANGCDTPDEPTSTPENTPTSVATNTVEATPTEGCTEDCQVTETPTIDPCADNACPTATNPPEGTATAVSTATPEGKGGVSLCTYIGIHGYDNDLVQRELKNNPEAAKMVRRNCPQGAGIPLPIEIGAGLLGLVAILAIVMRTRASH